MTDIRVVQQDADWDLSLDWFLRGDGTLDDSDDLATAAWIALFTDARAQEGDELPDPDATDRRGWWGDLDAERLHGGWPIGSRLWLLSRAKITGAGYRKGATVAQVEAYAYEAMEPFVTIGLATSVAARAERNGRGRIDLTVTLTRDLSRTMTLRYADLWT